MRVVIQVVSQAQVNVNSKLISKIEKGLLILFAVKKNDTGAKLDKLVNKIVNLRVFPDQNGKMNLSIKDIKGEILLVSQFTLYANTDKGYRPSFMDSAAGDQARPIYENLIVKLKEQDIKRVVSGQFATRMKVDLSNEGPTTIISDV